MLQLQCAKGPTVWLLVADAMHHSDASRDRCWTSASTTEASLSLSDMEQWRNDHGQHYRLNEETCASAPADGRLDVLTVLQAQQPPRSYDTRACTAPAFHGHMEVLQRLRQQMPSCSWDEHIIDAAASQGHVQIFAWLLNAPQPCPLDLCAKRLYLNILKYINLAPFKDLAEHAARRKDLELTKWVTSLEPAFTLCIVKRLLFEGWTGKLSFVSSIGCLQIGPDLQHTLRDALLWPGMMGDFAGMEDVLVAEGIIQPSACTL